MNDTPRIERPTRVFKMGAVELADPDPSMSPAEDKALYEPNYPHLANFTLRDPVPEDRAGQVVLIYAFEKPPAKTYGSGRHGAAQRRR